MKPSTMGPVNPSFTTYLWNSSFRLEIHFGFNWPDNVALNDGGLVSGGFGW
jgi:hypothetical protein